MKSGSICIDEMLELSKLLYKKHKGDWMDDTPESNIYWVGWLVGEIGEVIDIIKKKANIRSTSTKVLDFEKKHTDKTR